MASKAVSYLDRAILPIRILFGALFAFIASNVLHPWFFALVS